MFNNKRVNGIYLIWARASTLTERRYLAEVFGLIFGPQRCELRTHLRAKCIDGPHHLVVVLHHQVVKRIQLRSVGFQFRGENILNRLSYFGDDFGHGGSLWRNCIPLFEAQPDRAHGPEVDVDGTP